MKAKEYFEKYKDRLQEKDAALLEKAAGELVYDFDVECKELMEKRHVKRFESILSIIEELNDKWNALIRMIERECGTPILARDAFKVHWEKKIEAFQTEHNAERKPVEVENEEDI